MKNHFKNVECLVLSCPKFCTKQKVVSYQSAIPHHLHFYCLGDVTPTLAIASLTRPFVLTHPQKASDHQPKANRIIGMYEQGPGNEKALCLPVNAIPVDSYLNYVNFVSTVLHSNFFLDYTLLGASFVDDKTAKPYFSNVCKTGEGTNTTNCHQRATPLLSIPRHGKIKKMVLNFIVTHLASFATGAVNFVNKLGKDPFKRGHARNARLHAKMRGGQDTEQNNYVPLSVIYKSLLPDVLQLMKSEGIQELKLSEVGDIIACILDIICENDPVLASRYIYELQHGQQPTRKMGPRKRERSSRSHPKNANASDVPEAAPTSASAVPHHVVAAAPAVPVKKHKRVTTGGCGPDVCM